MPRRLRLIGLVVVSALLLVGCSTLPDGGVVHRVETAAERDVNEEPEITLPGPTPGASQEEVARGFMLGMTAVPLRMSAARSFLSTDSVDGWRPERSTLVFSSWEPVKRPGGIRIRLTDARRLDDRGSFAGRVPQAESRFDLDMVKEDGEWRIVNPPDAVLIPSWYFQDQYVGVNLYFFDRTRTVLVPERIYIPKGEQSASTLVSQLLRGPDEEEVALTEFPAGTTLDFVAPVSADGTVAVPLSGQVGRLDTEQLSRATAQLAWTLRQIPGVTTLRVTSGGVPIATGLGDDGQVDVLAGEAFAPWVDGSDQALYGIGSNGVVRRNAPVPGPLGRPGYSLRSVGVSLTGQTIYAVARDGVRVYRSSDGGRVRRVYEGTDVQEPSVDRFGRAWLVDRTATGARVIVVDGRRWREVTVPGVTGRQVSRLLVSRDGTGLVAMLPGGAGRIAVARVVRSADGAVQRVIASLDADPDLFGRLIDVAWVGANDLVVLSNVGGRSRVSFASADGAPPRGDEPGLDQWPGVARRVIGSPDVGSPLLLQANSGQLYRLDQGHWRLAEATNGLTAPTYVG